MLFGSFNFTQTTYIMPWISTFNSFEVTEYIVHQFNKKMQFLMNHPPFFMIWAHGSLLFFKNFQMIKNLWFFCYKQTKKHIWIPKRYVLSVLKRMWTNYVAILKNLRQIVWYQLYPKRHFLMKNTKYSTQFGHIARVIMSECKNINRLKKVSLITEKFLKKCWIFIHILWNPIKVEILRNPKWLLL